MSNHIPDDQIGRLSTAYAGQLHQLAARVRAAIGDDYRSDEELADLGGGLTEHGEMIASITVTDRDHGEVTYHSISKDDVDHLLVQREDRGRLMYAVVNEQTGEFG